MKYFWCTLTDRRRICIDANDAEHAQRRATEAGLTINQIVGQLPYPATPRLTPALSETPDFCYAPNQCVGRSCCPQNYACTE